MDILDTTQNLDFDGSTSIVNSVTCGCKCLYTYTASTEFKTIVDDHFSGNEQRRDEWTNPRRTWVLEFSKTPDTLRTFDKFFVRQKGKKRAFKWTWNKIVDGMDTGGNDITYNVRFDTDKIDYSIMEMGYSTFKVTIIQVISGV